MISAQARFRLLVALAAAIGIYTIVTSGPSGDSTAMVPARAAMPASRPLRPATNSSADLGRQGIRRAADRQDSEFLFAKHSWYVAPPPPPPVAAGPPPPPPPPTAPTVPFGVMGSYARPGDATVYFLTHGDRVFDVHVGDTIDGLYKVDGEANGQLQLTYLPLNAHQSIALGESQ